MEKEYYKMVFKEESDRNWWILVDVVEVLIQSTSRSSPQHNRVVIYKRFCVVICPASQPTESIDRIWTHVIRIDDEDSPAAPAWGCRGWCGSSCGWCGASRGRRRPDQGPSWPWAAESWAPPPEWIQSPWFPSSWLQERPHRTWPARSLQQLCSAPLPSTDSATAATCGLHLTQTTPLLALTLNYSTRNKLIPGWIRPSANSVKLSTAETCTRQHLMELLHMNDEASLTGNCTKFGWNRFMHFSMCMEHGHIEIGSNDYIYMSSVYKIALL